MWPWTMGYLLSTVWPNWQIVLSQFWWRHLKGLFLSFQKMHWNWIHGIQVMAAEKLDHWLNGRGGIVVVEYLSTWMSCVHTWLVILSISINCVLVPTDSDWLDILGPCSYGNLIILSVTMVTDTPRPQYRPWNQFSWEPLYYPSVEKIVNISNIYLECFDSWLIFDRTCVPCNPWEGYVDLLSSGLAQFPVRKYECTVTNSCLMSQGVMLYHTGNTHTTVSVRQGTIYRDRTWLAYQGIDFLL